MAFTSIYKHLQAFTSIVLIVGLAGCGDKKAPIEVHFITKTKENKFYSPNVPGFNNPLLTLHELEILSKADSVHITNIQLNRGNCRLNHIDLDGYRSDLKGLDYPIKHAKEEIAKLRKELEELPKNLAKEDRHHLYDPKGTANYEALQPIDKQYYTRVNLIEDLTSESRESYSKDCKNYLGSECLRELAKDIEKLEEKDNGGDGNTSKIQTIQEITKKSYDIDRRYACLDSGIKLFSTLTMNRSDDSEKFINYNQPGWCANEEDLTKEYEQKFQQLTEMLPPIQKKFQKLDEEVESAGVDDYNVYSDAHAKAYAKAYAKSGLKDNIINKTSRQYVENLKTQIAKLREQFMQNRSKLLGFMNIKVDSKDINAEVQGWYQKQVDKLRAQIKEDKAKILPIYQKDYQEQIAEKETELKKIEDKRTKLAQKIKTMESKGETMDITLKFGEKVMVKDYQHSCKDILEAKITTDQGTWTFSLGHD
ncbi:coiled-coil domain-containing protein [Helicobacter heilmannii]|uniref:Uncharacterized protein n=1 Tax=Helicobacter heilmannii TaxID=35817 RepID=A0A0K2Y7K3_HELHE|nr:hypothetical protein [Helicobacter heilmannii]BDQ26425.1 hypothetical protein ASB1_01010 [Helicobacter heilmannii]CCM11411.1 hypothetical protein BN341_13490 [Helicobacter heilmannii ASB1.4]CRI34833.1 hypothetical protein HHE01_06340 [Helicobacter heilmannii]